MIEHPLSIRTLGSTLFVCRSNSFVPKIFTISRITFWKLWLANILQLWKNAWIVDIVVIFFTNAIFHLPQVSLWYILHELVSQKLERLLYKTMFDNWSQIKNRVTLNDLLAFTKAANIRPYRWRLRVLHNTFNMEVFTCQCN